MQSFLWFSVPFLIAILINVLGFTWRIRFEGWDKVLNEENGILYSFWHENLLPVLYTHRFRKVGVVVSPSRDGEIVARVLKIMGYRIFRGDTESGGKRAVIQLIKYGNHGNEIAITPDGPKGPRRKVKKGIIEIGRIGNFPIYAASIKAGNCFRFSSWDRFMLPLPFSKVLIKISGPLNRVDPEELENKMTENDLSD